MAKFEFPIVAGPSVEKAELSWKEIVNAWEFAELVRNEDRVEVLALEDEVGAIDTVSTALKKIGIRDGKDIAEFKHFSEENLAGLLKPEKGVKKVILITGDRSKGIVDRLVEERSDLFKAVRVLGIELPKDYSDTSTPKERRTFYQASMFLRGACAGLLNDSRTSVVRILFEDILKGCYDGDADELLKGLLEKKDETRESTIRRIQNCSERTVRLLSVLTAAAIEHLRLTMREVYAAL